MSPEVPIIILILAIPVYFFSEWILKKFNLGNETNRKYLAIIPTIIISPIIYAGIIMIWIFSISYYPKTNFTKEKWETNKEERYKMSYDIIKSELLIGKTMDEVTNLLGDDFYKYGDNHIAYDIGFVPGLFRIDPDVLDIYFENGKVIKVGQFEHYALHNRLFGPYWFTYWGPIAVKGLLPQLFWIRRFRQSVHTSLILCPFLLIDLYIPNPIRTSLPSNLNLEYNYIGLSVTLLTYCALLALVVFVVKKKNTHT